MRHRHLSGGLILVGLMAVALAGCPSNPTPQPPPMPDASDASQPPPPTPGSCDWATACTALRGAGCPLGAAADCATSMARDVGSGKVANAATGKPLTCNDVAAVRTKADAVRLGFACQ